MTEKLGGEGRRGFFPERVIVSGETEKFILSLERGGKIVKEEGGRNPTDSEILRAKEILDRADGRDCGWVKLREKYGFVERDVLQGTKKIGGTTGGEMSVGSVEQVNLRRAAESLALVEECAENRGDLEGSFILYAIRQYLKGRINAENLGTVLCHTDGSGGARENRVEEAG